MSQLITKLILFLGCIQLMSMSEWYEKGNPIFLTDKNYRNLISRDRRNFKVIKFFTPWCRYCRISKPAFDYYHANQLKGQQFYEVNCESQPGLCQYFQIKMFPTLVFLWDNNQFAYQIPGYYPPSELLPMIDDILLKMKYTLFGESWHDTRILETSNQPSAVKIDELNEGQEIKMLNQESEKGRIIKQKEQIKQRNEHGQNNRDKDQLILIEISVDSVYRTMIYLGIIIVGGLYFINIIPKNVPALSQKDQKCSENGKYEVSFDQKEEESEPLSMDQIPTVKYII